MDLEEPEDLGIRIGTIRQSTWEDVLKQANSMIENMEKGLEVQREIKVLAERIIAEEKQKL